MIQASQEDGPGKSLIRLAGLQGHTAMFSALKNDIVRDDVLNDNNGSITVYDLAVSCGHLDLVKWLDQAFSVKRAWLKDIKNSLKNEKTLELLQYFHAMPNFKVSCHAERMMFNVALMECQHINQKAHVIDWLLTKFPNLWEPEDWRALAKSQVADPLPSIYISRPFNLIYVWHKHSILRSEDMTRLASQDYPYFYLATTGQIQMLTWLIETFPKESKKALNRTDGYYQLTFVQRMSQLGRLDVLELVQDNYPHKVNFLARPVNDYNWTCLTLAAMNGHLSVVDWLIRTFPGKWNLKDCGLSHYRHHPRSPSVSIAGANVLHLAAMEGHVNVLKYFHKNVDPGEVDFFALDGQGWNLAHYAAYYCDGGLPWLLQTFPDGFDANLRTLSSQLSLWDLAMIGGCVKNMGFRRYVN